jgi:hypothetical protein
LQIRNILLLAFISDKLRSLAETARTSCTFLSSYELACFIRQHKCLLGMTVLHKEACISI